MSRPIRVAHPIYNLLPTEIDGYDSLAELALDMRWAKRNGRYRDNDRRFWRGTEVI